MLEAIGAGSSPRIGNRDWADIWEESEEFAATKEVISGLKRARQSATKESDLQLPQGQYASPFSHQLKLACKRMFLAYWRTPSYLFTRLFNHVVIALLTVCTHLRGM
jgi:hypothetical protein